jgi:protein-tyrosine phosphatase
MKPINNNIINNLYNLSQPMTNILPYLYLGNAYNARDYYELNNKNVTMIVNCTQEFPNFFQYDLSIRYINIPILDENNVNIYQYFDVITEKIHEYHLNNPSHSILIHCYMGASRSVAIVCAYLIKYNNMTIDEAIQYIENRRPLINMNIDFYLQLLEYQVTNNSI